jgi:hypothetical protein
MNLLTKATKTGILYLWTFTFRKERKMTMDELMSQILAILPNAVFGEENTTGEILVATGLVDNNGTLTDLDD